MKKIIFTLKKDSDGYPPIEFESVWGIRVHDNSYRIANTPYYIYGVSEGDLVAIENRNEELHALHVCERGGNSTLRVFAENPSVKQQIIERINDLGGECSFLQKLSLFAVNIPKDANFLKIDDYLRSISDGERIAYEDTCLQHKGVNRTRESECLELATIPLRMN